MPTCTICEGTKQTQLTIHSAEGTTKRNVPCFHCEGTGELTQTQIEQIEWEQTQWCECTTQTGSTYYADGMHPECHKHHYRCNTCNLITQIG